MINVSVDAAPYPGYELVVRDVRDTSYFRASKPNDPASPQHPTSSISKSTPKPLQHRFFCRGSEHRMMVTVRLDHDLPRKPWWLPFDAVE